MTSLVGPWLLHFNWDPVLLHFINSSFITSWSWVVRTLLYHSCQLPLDAGHNFRKKLLGTSPVAWSLRYLHYDCYKTNSKYYFYLSPFILKEKFLFKCLSIHVKSPASQSHNQPWKSQADETQRYNILQLKFVGDTQEGLNYHTHLPLSLPYK